MEDTIHFFFVIRVVVQNNACITSCSYVHANTILLFAAPELFLTRNTSSASLLIKVHVCHDSRCVPSHPKGVSDQIQDIHQGNRRNGKQKDFGL